MISPPLARLLIREHVHKPIKGKVLVLGRQTVPMNFENLLRLMKEEGYVPPQLILDQIVVKEDEDTRFGKGEGYVSDEVFFQLLGADKLVSLDVSGYEKCDIIHDLNKPIPMELEGQFDFIVDGGTFDHLFDLRVAFENVVRLLKPGGRVFQWNAASNFTGKAYLCFGPDFFFDYYVLNRFDDCKVYIAVTDRQACEQWDMYEFTGEDYYGYFRSPLMQLVIVLAEKGIDSTYDKMPIQATYREESLWEFYRKGKDRAKHSSRALILSQPSQPSAANKSIPTQNLFYINSLKKKFSSLCRKIGVLPPVKKKKKQKNPAGYKYLGKL